MVTAPTPRPGLTLVVLLFVDPERVAEFRDFERRAAAIMSRYDGRIERRLELHPEAGSPRPHELHIVTFPDEEAFEHYRSDPEARALAEVRERVVQRTVIWRASGAEPPAV
jgi:uncharacterized protein (DUF1330 family)